MSTNYLEQLAVEWYEFRGYFVRRNVPVGRRGDGGHEAELGVVAVAPAEGRVVHIEASMDAHSWEVREQRFGKKFAAGREHLAAAVGDFGGGTIEQIALIALGSRVNHPTLGGGEVLTLPEFLVEILAELVGGASASPVPQQYPILRTLQFVAEHRRALLPILLEQDPRQISF
jgi:hypothetical protein